MASAMVLEITEYVPASTGLDVTYRVVFVRDNLTLDIDQITVLLGSGDTTNTLISKLSTAVRNRATALGYSLAPNAIILPAFSKG